MAKGRQVLDGDSEPGRHGVIDRPVEAAQHTTVGEFGKQAVDRFVEPQLAVVDQVRNPC